MKGGGMPKQTYWIADPNGGAKALVEGVEERNRWTHVQGWAETEAPEAGDQVWVYNAETGGRAKLPYEVTGDGSYWRNVGFEWSAPEEPVDLTKDPALRDQTKPEAVKTPPAGKADEITPSKPAAGADTKEK